MYSHDRQEFPKFKQISNKNSRIRDETFKKKNKEENVIEKKTRKRTSRERWRGMKDKISQRKTMKRLRETILKLGKLFFPISTSSFVLSLVPLPPSPFWFLFKTTKNSVFVGVGQIAV
jgi:hypothetical protein